MDRKLPNWLGWSLTLITSPLAGAAVVGLWVFSYKPNGADTSWKDWASSHFLVSSVVAGLLVAAIYAGLRGSLRQGANSSAAAAIVMILYILLCLGGAVAMVLAEIMNGH